MLANTLVDKDGHQVERSTRIKETLWNRLRESSLAITKEGTSALQFLKKKVWGFLQDDKDAFFVADLDEVVKQHMRFLKALPQVKPFYAVKCNSSPEILRTLAILGAGFDCASKAEITWVLDMGVPAANIIYANPCKQPSYIRYAAQRGVTKMTFDCENELVKVAELHPNAEMILRIRTNDEGSVACLSKKFGAPLQICEHLLKKAKELNVSVNGVSFHIGSGSANLQGFHQAIGNARQLFDIGNKLGHKMKLLDIGGGFPGHPDFRPVFEEFAGVIMESLDQYFPREEGVEIIAEPGRYYVTSAYTEAVNITAKKEESFRGHEASMDEDLDEDLREASMDEDLREASMDEDLREASMDEDLREASMDEDLREASMDEDLREASMDEDLREASMDEDLREASMDEDLREASMDEDLHEDSSEASVDEDSSEASVDEDSSEASVDEDSSEASVDVDSSEASVDVDSSEASVDVDSSEASVDVDSSEASVDVDSSEASVDVDSSEASVDVDSSEASVDVDSSEASVDVDSSEASVDVDSSEASVDVDSSEASVDVDSSEASVDVDSSEASVDVDSSEAFTDKDEASIVEVSMDKGLHDEAYSEVSLKDDLNEASSDGIERKMFSYYLNDGAMGSFLFSKLYTKEIKLIPMVEKECLPSVQHFPSRLWGPSCSDKDILYDNIDLPELEVGDWLLFPNIGAYFPALYTVFNGFLPPPVYYIVSQNTWSLLETQLNNPNKEDHQVEENSGLEESVWNRVRKSSVTVVEDGTSALQFLKKKIKYSFNGDKDAFFVCDLNDVVKQHKRFVKALPQVKPFYAVKCNSSLEILRTLAILGAHFDCSSKAEINWILGMGVSAADIIYTNPCKHLSHIQYAAQRGVTKIVIDCESELVKVAEHHPNAELILRIHTIDGGSITNLSEKFGAPLEICDRLLRMAKSLGVSVTGVSFHVGSGSEDPDYFREAIKNARHVFDIGKKLGHTMRLLDIGGGFPGHPDFQPTFEEFAVAIMESLDQYFPREDNVDIIAEPGRYYVTSAFTQALNIITKKEKPLQGSDGKDRKTFSYYLSTSLMLPYMISKVFEKDMIFNVLVEKDGLSSSVEKFRSRLWGPSCTDRDVIKENIDLPELEVGDWLLFPNMGAYFPALYTVFNGFLPIPVFYIVSPDVWRLLERQWKKLRN
ncbi:uncharacterized protein PAF06_004214 [Gastrophryne carolinensis]